MYRGSLEKRQKHKKCDLVFSPSRSNLGLVSSRFAGFVRNRELYNLGMVSGPVLNKNKGKKFGFHTFGRNSDETWANFCEIWANLGEFGRNSGDFL